MNLIKIIVSQLPRQSEEESSASRIARQELIKILLRATEGQEQKPVALVEIVEQILDSMSLLDPDELANGYWKFVSHAAQLCALSILNTLADPRQKLIPTDFWHSNVGDSEKQQQKKVLQSLEDRRYENHQDGPSSVSPIRFVYVAWGLVKIGDKFLFHQREASEHFAEYGLIGGKTKLSDLKKTTAPSALIDDLLKTLQSPASEAMFQALEYTLARELQEEANITAKQEHYVATTWRDLKPYRECMGAAPNYALTEYFFRLYSIKLSTAGYLPLRNRMKTDKRLIECSLDEIVSGKTVGGASTLRIEALYRDYNDNRDELRRSLEGIYPSYINQYLFNDEKKDGLVLSLANNILRGSSGKEQPLSVMSLTPDQKEILLTLAIHGKGLPLELAAPQKATLHEFGWLEIHDDDLLVYLRELCEKMRQADSPLIEAASSNYYRLSLLPDMLFFDPEYFSFRLKEIERKWLLTFKRKALSTSFWNLPEEQQQIEIATTLALQLEKVASEDGLHVVDDEDLPKKVRSALKDKYQAYGLRQFLISKDSYYSFTCPEKGLS